ncbi:transmembrane protein 209 [Trichonephila clavata]|uniref:Transmembrane protein 209 n=1 Tax=Trichonephila clavata TaxID=2740835 RepID=A0A8X6LK81_TRICU|nr:transmembrane protein 209 [Trichonephila clavata]
MAATDLQTIYLKFMRSLYDFPQAVKWCLISLYCRVYKFLNTCFIMQTIYSLYYSILSFSFVDHQKLEWKTHRQNPVCRDILKRKYFLNRSKHSLSWTVLYVSVAFLLYGEMKSGFFAGMFGDYSVALWYTEVFAFILFSLNACISFVWYVWSIFSKPMPISPIQQKLFGIRENDPGFQVKKIDDSVSDPVKPERLQFNSWRDSFESNSPSYLSVTPLNYSYNSWGSTSGGSPSLDTTSSSWNYYRASSPMNLASTPKLNNGDRSFLRTLNYSDDIESPYGRPIRNKKQLEDYLRIHEEEDKRRKSMSFEESKPFMTKMTTVDNSPMSVLSKCRYQRAYRLPHLETTEDDSSEIHCGDNVLNKLKVTDKMLTVWCERMRKWICQTILVKLVREIDEINMALSEIGLPEFQIGNVSLFALHQIAATKSQHLPTLLSVLPYVDMHSNQEYLVRRLKDLAHGGCMGDFKWNSGGNYEDKQWCDDLPTDSALVMHILCCYLDAHLPPDPHFPEGKPFTSKYFKKIPEKSVLSKDLTYIYQSSLNPPHFKVVLGEELYTLPKGRNNMFCALVIFLHYMKTKECGMLGRVNLGQSGLNMLWILN